jgi:hypothetical protein
LHNGKDKIALAVGAVIDRYKMAKSRDVSSRASFALSVLIRNISTRGCGCD